LLFIFGGRLSRAFRISIGKNATTSALITASVLELLIGVYGGYFGAGIGILNLAMLTALGMTDIHAMNALKVILDSVMNGVAVVVFVAAGVIFWREAGIMTAGGLIGGYFGAHYAQRLPVTWVRGFVMAVASAVTMYYFWKIYG
jgi:hypothetical protein